MRRADLLDLAAACHLGKVLQLLDLWYERHACAVSQHPDRVCHKLGALFEQVADEEPVAGDKQVHRCCTGKPLNHTPVQPASNQLEGCCCHISYDSSPLRAPSSLADKAAVHQLPPKSQKLSSAALSPPAASSQPPSPPPAGLSLPTSAAGPQPGPPPAEPTPPQLDPPPPAATAITSDTAVDQGAAPEADSPASTVSYLPVCMLVAVVVGVWAFRLWSSRQA